MQSVMTWVLWILALGNVRAQPLPPGTYRHLKPTHPLVLDTGNFTFIGLEMKKLGKGIWLDARKARSLTLSHCRFEGTGSGTAVVSSGHLTVQHSQFSNMETGILSQTAPGTGLSASTSVQISGNRFTDLGIAIALDRNPGEDPAPTQLDFTLRCNEFINHPQTTNIRTRKGLVIGEGVKLRAPDALGIHPDQIGGIEQFNSGNQYPNANVWPTAQVNRKIRQVNPLTGEQVDLHNSTSGWQDSPYWKSIENNSGISIAYHRYDNEFVKNDLPTPVAQTFPAVSVKMATLGNINDLATPVDPEDPDYVFACDNLTDPDIVLFPARIAVITADITSGKNEIIADQILLNEAMPNPSEQGTRISVSLPAHVESATLQIVDMVTGKVLQNIPLSGRGKLEVLLDTRKAPVATYIYRLIANGKLAGTRKLVVRH